MRPKIHWIDLPAGVRLAIMPRPRAGDWLDAEIAGWGAEGIGVIVSLLEAGGSRNSALTGKPAFAIINDSADSTSFRTDTKG
jgi:hypothetical protein